MKKATIARFVIGGAAIFAAFGLAACGAETGAPEGVGESTAALSRVAAIDDVTPAGVTPVSTQVNAAASCKISLSGNDYLLVASGFDSAGSETRNWYLFNPAGTASQNPSAQWVLSGQFGASGDEVAFARMITVPGHADACLLTGGIKGTATTVKSFRFTLTAPSGVLTLTPTADGALPASKDRSKFEVSTCSSDKIAVFGGYRGAASPSITGDISVWTPPNPWSASAGSWSSVGSLVKGRYDYALAPTYESNTTHYVAFGGRTALGDPTNTVEAIELKTSNNVTCSTVTATNLTAPAGQSLPSGRHLLPAFEYSSSLNGSSQRVSEFKAPGGDTSITATHVPVRDMVNLQVTWAGTPALTSVTTTSNAINSAIRAPKLVKVDSGFTTNEFILIGGENSSLNAVTDLQKYTGTWANATTVLSQARAYSVAEFLPSASDAVNHKDYVFAVGGQSVAGTELASGEKIEAP